MIDRDFLAELKRTTEAKWSSLTIDPSIYGFQFQPSTRWMPGLSDEQIAAYEGILGVKLPDDFKTWAPTVRDRALASEKGQAVLSELRACAGSVGATELTRTPGERRE